MKELLKALINSKKAIKPILKEGENRGKKYSYVTLQDILQAVEPVLLENDLVVSFSCVQGCMECTLWHSSGESISSKIEIDIFVDNNPQKEMEKPQRVGAAITYARKYLLMALLNLSTSEPDADSDEYARKRQVQQPPQQVQQQVQPQVQPQVQQPQQVQQEPVFQRLTNDQLRELKKLMDSKKMSKEDFMQLAYEVTGNPYIKSSTELPYDCYRDLLKAIEERFPSSSKLYY